MSQSTLRDQTIIARRTLLSAGAGLVALQLVPLPLRATPADMASALREVFGTTAISEGRVQLKLPPLSENGNSVPMSISVDSPMTADDHVTEIHVFSPENPLPNVAGYYLGPRAGKAELSTRIRLADTQVITAVAKMNDGSLWSGTAKTIVTLAACIDLG